MHTFASKQYFPVDHATMWDFIATPKNLSVITPPEMDFKTLSGDDRRMFPGQVIHYTVKPIFGIKMEWVTEITHVVEGSYFVDEQRFGPYAFWHHKHFLHPLDGGVMMEDIVHYKLPMGPLGKLVEPYLVRPQLEKIFEYRRQVLEKKFGTIVRVP